MSRTSKTAIGAGAALLGVSFFILRAVLEPSLLGVLSAALAVVIGVGACAAVYNALLAALVRTTRRIAVRNADPVEEAIPEFAALGRITSALMREADDKVDIIRRDRAFLAGLFDSLEEGILCVDSQGMVLFQNEIMPESLATRGCVGRHYLEVVRHPDALVAVREILAGMPPPAGPILLHSRGRDYRASVRKTSELILIIVYDVTEEEKTLRMRREFFENASHELKTPLTSIQGYAEILTSRTGDDVSTRAAEAIARNAMRMTRLVSDMSEIASLESGRIPLNLSVVALPSFFSNLAVLTTGTLQAREQSMQIECAPDLQVHADPVLLEHLLLNLIDNASRYSPERTPVTAGALRKDAGTVLYVADRGPGIALEFHDRIFERFFRVDPDRSRAAGGTGLGLSIVRHIARIHGGRAWVDDREGGGSVFSVFLPDAAAN